MVNQAFHVLTEFRFDVAHAVTNSQTLQNEVGKISDAANGAMHSIQRMGIGLVTQMGLGAGGILGFLYNAIQASEKFAQSQRNLANILLSNNEVFKNGGFDFASAMGQSEAIMENVIKKAREFALDPNTLMESVKAIAPVLLSHKLETSSALPMSIDIARGFLKSAPTLGIDPNLAMGQLTDLAMGRANMGDRLFQRLVSETAPMRQAGITGSQAFNVLPAQKRIELLRASLLQFGSNADVLRGNMESLNGQIGVFSSLIKGQFAIFRKIGDVIGEQLRIILTKINGFLINNGKKISDNIAKIIEPLIKDPQALLETIMQLGKLKEDLDLSGKLFGFMVFMEAIKFVQKGLALIGIRLGGFFTLGKVLTFIYNILKFALFNFMDVAKLGFKLGGFLLRGVLWPIMLFMTVLQGISRGFARAKIEDAKWIADHMDLITNTFNKGSIILRKFMLPITMAIDGIADIIAWIFTFGSVAEKALNSANSFMKVLNFFADLLVGILAIVAGIENIIIGRVFKIVGLLTGDKTVYGSTLDNFKEGFSDFFSKYANPLETITKEQAVSQANININSIEINNAFKEQAQPDRIAFTLKEQILKTAMNPQQAQGRSLRGALSQ